jgi:hypothetical protein
MELVVPMEVDKLQVKTIVVAVPEAEVMGLEIVRKRLMSSLRVLGSSVMLKYR